ncbi:MAG: hypothetical protein IPJ78_19330 [Gemmatimonadetes bacterium]|nr:hypothetical protein [Gemmatimonadota bacterium]
MTEEHLPETDEMAADLELIINALNGHLSPERVAEVTRRLEEDPAFRDLAAPMLLTWSVPSYLERHPRPVGELEAAWTEFAEQAGIAQPATSSAPRPSGRVLWSRRRTWERIMWFVVAFMLIVPMGATIWYDVIKPEYFPEPTDGYVAPAVPATTEAEPVPYRSGWITLENGIDVQLTPGAELRVSPRRLRGMRHLILTGTARFRVPELDPPGTPTRTQALVVETPVGFVTASESEFTVAAGADTTEVQLHVLPGRSPLPPSPLTLASVIEPADRERILTLSEPGSARLVRGSDPVRLPSSH